MRRIFVYAVLADMAITALVLYNQIKEFLLSHPWWVSVIAALPEIAVPVLAYFELRHSAEANELRTEANNHRIHANALQEEQNESVDQIAKLQGELNKLQGERNQLLDKIAANTQRPLSEAEVNARILRKYLGQRAFVTEGGNHWGAGGAVIAGVNENNILTLFTPAGYRRVVSPCAVTGCTLWRVQLGRARCRSTSWNAMGMRPTTARQRVGTNATFNPRM